MNIEFVAKVGKHAGPLRDGRRFYTSVDMAILKKDTATENAKVKRGEIEIKNSQVIKPCGCGREGCFISYNSSK